MNYFLGILVLSLTAMAGVATILWIILRRTSTNRRIHLRDASLSETELVAYAQKSAARHRVSRKRDYFHWPLPDLERNYASIRSVYNDLSEDARQKLPVPASAEWLLDNFYIITEQVQELRLDLNKKSYLRLPVLQEAPRKGSARIYAVAADIVELTNGQMDESILSNYLEAYQEENTLFEREIGAIPLVVKLSLIENLRGICENVQETRLQWQKADDTYRMIAADFGKDQKNVAKKLMEHMKEAEALPAYVEHLHYLLRQSRDGLLPMARELDTFLEAYGTCVERITHKEHNAQSLITVSMSNTVTSLRYFAAMDWSDFMRSASVLEKILEQDPDGSYPKMDSDTRERYRRKAEDIAAQYRYSEFHIAREAIRLAKRATVDSLNDPPSPNHAAHVGYYLIGRGLPYLTASMPKALRLRLVSALSSRRARKIQYFSAIGSLSAALLFIAVQYCLSAGTSGLLYLLLAGIAMLIPASEIAIQIVNRVACTAVKPIALPKLELKDGIPEGLSTMVVIPTLLPTAHRVQELLGTLEGHFLANRDEHLFFALLGAFKDASQVHVDGDEIVIQAALSGIRALNQKYAAGKLDKFYFFHRGRQYNPSNDIWIGWERKRGALLEFGRLLTGFEDTSFSCASAVPPRPIQYVITLDSDTQLPMGMARSLVAAMAHPLNRPVVDLERGMVVEGYGILQPRIDVDMECAGQTVFSRIFTSPEGIDPYSGAVSDVYQDLFGEGIFTGKGIYDLEVYQQILMDTFPENTVLSHDLLEGSYLRAALATDLKLIDSFPTRYNAYASRQLRWIRGDWQLLPHLLQSVRTGMPGRIVNPLSALSRWKIADNLRHSLLAPAYMLIVFLAITVFPGHGFFWLGTVLSIIFFPCVLSAGSTLASATLFRNRTKRYLAVRSALKSSLAQCALNLAFLPYQAWQAFSGVFTTLARLFTGKNLLAWVTSADVEVSQRNTVFSYLRMMVSVYFQIAIALALSISFKGEILWVLAPFLLFWAASPLLAYGISRNENGKDPKVLEAEQKELGRIARKTWRYFEEFAGEKAHYLAPDNYQLDPPKGIAWRTSPTNIGFGLLAVLSARDFGYIGTAEMMDLLGESIFTIETLEKWNGHLYNWYDTRTLMPMKPLYVSTVDSGNLAGYLMTLEQGLLQYLKRPLADNDFTRGVRDTLCCAGKDGATAWEDISKHIGSNNADTPPMDLLHWDDTMRLLSNRNWLESIKSEEWKDKFRHMLERRKQETTDFLPAVKMLACIPLTLANSAEGNPKIAELLSILHQNPALCEMPNLYEATAVIIDEIIQQTSERAFFCNEASIKWLRDGAVLLRSAAHTAWQMMVRCETLAQRIASLWEAMTFLPLYDAKKKLFSIGYNLQEEKLTASYYDLLASEARQASYIAIAKGEVPVAHWFRMGRALTVVDKYKGLVSWTGTMFEYLMPLLIMKNYRNTLLDESYAFAIRCQKKYGKLRNMPWGASESAFYSLDTSHDYQYKAIGVPWLGLKRGLAEDAVTAPYATFLALVVDPVGAWENIRRLQQAGMEGPYGLYEAADYTPERLVFETERFIIKSYMAHHQGMSLVALANHLHDGVMQERFHHNPAIHMARMLLQEKTPAKLLLLKTVPEKLGIARREFRHAEPAKYEKYIPDSQMPKTHVLTNGNYSVMLTDRGTGYSKSKMAEVTRWREDRTQDAYGMFFYLRNVDTQEVWSAAHAPLNQSPDLHTASFEADKAIFTRSGEWIDTKQEVTVASGDNTEIRRLTLKNNGATPASIEITSYFEVIITPQADDIAHPAFSNLFIETAFDPERNCIIASRRPRADLEKRNWLAHTAITSKPLDSAVQYETDRMQFLGRGRTPTNPEGLRRGKPLSGTVGAVLNPSISLRVRLAIKPGETASVSFVTLIGGNREHILAQVDGYREAGSIRHAFHLALQRGRIETNFRGFNGNQMSLYQGMIAHLLFISPAKQKHNAMISQNHLGQSSLWRHSISGDKPLVLLRLYNESQIGLLYELLKAHEFWRLMDVKVDLVIVCDEEHHYANPLQRLISDIVSTNRGVSIFHEPGDVFVLEQSKVSQGELALLYAASRIVLEGEKGTIREQLHPLTARVLPARIKTIKEDQYPIPLIQRQSGLQFDNGLGGFRPDGKEYIIQPSSSQTTPAPWVNVIANPQFGFVSSESGAGYTWHANSHEYRLTPWANDAVSDTPGEVFYLTDIETGVSWTPTLQPIREDGPYTIRHGFGYTVYEHTSHEIEQRLTQHAPVEDSVKISALHIKSQSSTPRTLSIVYYVRPVLGIQEQATSPHIRTFQRENVAILAENPYNEDFPGRVCFLHTSGENVSITGDRWEVFGEGNLSAPDCLMQERLSGAVGIGFDPCCALRTEISLMPGESKTLIFLLGSAQNAQEAGAISTRYANVAQAQESLDEVRQFWKDKLGAIQVSTPDASMNLMLNGWLQYQVVSCRLWARTGHYQSGGAFGFRDQLQDALAVAGHWPELARKQILLHAQHQFLQGDVLHWWHDPHGKGVRTRISDDLLWLPYVTAEYIRISGDEQIFLEELPFLEGEELTSLEMERYGNAKVSKQSATLYLHCICAIDRALKFGSHGLPLMGGGDWNDGMNAVGAKGRGESVWLAWFLITILDQFGPLCRQRGDSETAIRYALARKALCNAVEEFGWDGDWYRRAYFDDGTPLGSTSSGDCRIDSIAQSWSVLSGAAGVGRANQAMGMLEDYLVSQEEGIIKLLTPPFDTGTSEPGYIKGYVPGVRENGGQYTHAAVWAIMAFARLGRCDKAAELFALINPINHTENYREYSKYKVEPYVMAADVYANWPHAGRGGWSWYTGAAGWMYQAGMGSILGLQKNGNVLTINPCVPCEWKEYEIAYRFHETLYRFHVYNACDGTHGGKWHQTMVDGEEAAAGKVILVNDGAIHDVRVTIK